MLISDNSAAGTGHARSRKKGGTKLGVRSIGLTIAMFRPIDSPHIDLRLIVEPLRMKQYRDRSKFEKNCAGLSRSLEKVIANLALFSLIKEYAIHQLKIYKITYKLFMVGAIAHMISNYLSYEAFLQIPPFQRFRIH